MFKVDGFAGADYKKLRDVLGLLRDAYCRHVGVEYTHILEPEQQKWLQERVEAKHDKPTVAQQKYILRKLNAAEAFETFLQTKYVAAVFAGRRRDRHPDDGRRDRPGRRARLDEVVIGMPHRGRLNVLANIVGKPYSQIFSEFEGNLNPSQAHGSGDVKYHLGATGTYSRCSATTTLRCRWSPTRRTWRPSTRCWRVWCGPSRTCWTRATETTGSRGADDAARRRRVRRSGRGRRDAEPGAAAGYRTGGTIHIIVNNQIGFTTSPSDSRSSEYCTDVAKMIGAPIFHVNGDDPRRAWVARLAMDFRQQFKKDVVIDMLCYRRRGHNEGDDPSMTQPAMYDVIDLKRGVRKAYTEALIGRGDISMKEAEDALRDYQGQLERVFNEVRDLEKHAIEPSDGGVRPDGPAG